MASGLDGADALLATIASQIPGAVYRIRFTEPYDYRVLFVSEGARRLFGLGVDDPITEASVLLRHVVGEDAAQMHRLAQRCHDTLQSWRCDFRIRTPEGLKWIRGDGKPHRGADGAIVWDGILIDVTEQKTAQERESRLLHRISTILESTTDAVFTVDADWRFTYFNERAKALITGGADFTGRNGWEAFPDAVGTVFWDQYHRVRDEGCSVEFEAFFDRVGKWFEVHAHPMDGGVAVFFRDVSDRRRAEEELVAAKEAAEAANRAKSAFLANMSHELRTPLNAIMGFSEIMRGELLGPLGQAGYLEYVNDIHQSGQHLLQIVNDVLDLARIEAGASPLEEEEIEMGAIIDDALRTVRNLADAKKIAVRREVPPDCPHLLADRRAVRQVLLKLLSNAVKFTEAGEVNITVRPAPGGLSIVVRDTGIGIGEQDLKLLCQPFQQADLSLARRHQGTGMGLALAKRLIERHDGKLTIESAHGIGTTVVASFPPSRTI